jgi:hypothetical protein
MADGLIEVFHELEGFRCRATDHYPKSKVYFNANIIACLLFLIFEDSKHLTLRMEQQFQRAIGANSRLCAASSHSDASSNRKDHALSMRKLKRGWLKKRRVFVHHLSAVDDRLAI